MDKAALPREILLLSYFFPSYPGIGGRRWAKFAKYMAQLGIRVHVICAGNPFPEISTWFDDVKDNPNIVIHPLLSRYPTILLSNPRSVGEKLKYKAAKLFIDFISKGSPYDCAMFWEKPMVETASTLLRKHKIENVVATGAPFYVTVYATRLKKEFPTLNVICDFRDPWTDAEFFLGFSRLSKERKEYEIALEQEVLAQSDHITGVADWMIENLHRRAPQTRAQFHVIPNGFDPEEVDKLQPMPSRQDGKIRFISAGSLYLQAIPVFRALMDALLKLKKRDERTFHRLDFRFYGTQPDALVNEYQEKGLSCITFHPLVSASQMLKETRDADFGMIFLDYAKTFTVRCVEYVGLRLPIVVFSYTDRMAKILVENGIGYGCHPDSMEKDLQKIVSDFDHGLVRFNEKFDRSAFDIRAITDQILKLLKRPACLD